MAGQAGSRDTGEVNRHRKIDLRFWAGIAISIFFLALLFRKVDPAELWRTIRGLDPLYLVPAVGLTFASYFGRAIRWKYLLLPLKKCSMENLFPATIIGYMANNLLPARIGEFIRAFVLADREKLPKAAVFATLVIDRLLDGFTILVVLVLTLVTLELPPGSAIGGATLRTAGFTTFAAYIVIIGFLVLLRVRTDATLRFVRGAFGFFPALGERIVPILESFIHGIRLPEGWGNLGKLVLSSALIWLFALLPIDLALRSFGIVLPFAASMFILVLLVFAVMVPASPGSVGTSHYACFIALTAFGISDDKAVSMALVVHAIGFFPVIFAGFICMWKYGISLKGLRREAS